MRRFRGPVCPEWLQEQLLSWLIEGAEAGRPGFKEMLTLTPCDIFPLLRGRTLWLMGDSMMQVCPLGRRPGKNLIWLSHASKTHKDRSALA